MAAAAAGLTRSRRSRGALGVRLSAALGLVCLLLAGVLGATSGRQGVAAAALGEAWPPPAGAAVRAPQTVPLQATPQFAVGPVAPVSGGVPTELRLAGRLRVSLDPVGVSADGNVEIPGDPAHAGWWAAGSAPGDPAGSTVLVGHLDSGTRGLGAFAALLDVSLGDEVQIVDASGAVFRYAITGRQQVSKAALPASVFSREGTPRLVLITCGGRFDPRTHHYDDNIIVTAQPLPAG